MKRGSSSGHKDADDAGGGRRNWLRRSANSSGNAPRDSRTNSSANASWNGGTVESGDDNEEGRSLTPLPKARERFEWPFEWPDVQLDAIARTTTK